VAVTLDGADLVTAFTTSLGAVSNVGPGLGMVGPMENFSFYSGWTKAFLSFMMVVGRLEIFPILLLFQPSIWRRR
jgi:trk system potassium uptake protein TrkH